MALKTLVLPQIKADKTGFKNNQMISGSICRYLPLFVANKGFRGYRLCTKSAV
jgi:hypothetical protein